MVEDYSLIYKTYRLSFVYIVYVCFWLILLYKKITPFPFQLMQITIALSAP